MEYCVVCRSRLWALQKQLKWSWCHLGYLSTWVGPRNHVLDAVQIPAREGRRGNLEDEKRPTRECLVVDILKATQQGADQYGADADWGGHCATWWIRLNCSHAAAMRPYVKVHWPLENIIIITADKLMLPIKTWEVYSYFCSKNYQHEPHVGPGHPLSIHFLIFCSCFTFPLSLFIIRFMLVGWLVGWS